MPMKKTKKFICFEMLKDVRSFKKIVLVFSSRKQGGKYVQNILHTPNAYLCIGSKQAMYWIQTLKTSKNNSKCVVHTLL